MAIAVKKRAHPNLDVPKGENRRYRLLVGLCSTVPVGIHMSRGRWLVIYAKDISTGNLMVGRPAAIGDLLTGNASVFRRDGGFFAHLAFS
jgi:hypothetical protein